MKFLDDAESKLDEEINDMEHKLSGVTKNIVFDIALEPEIKPKEYPLTKQSKLKFKSKSTIITESKTKSKIISKKQASTKKGTPKNKIDEINVSGEVIKSYYLDFGFQPASKIKTETLTSGVKRVKHSNGDISHVYKDGTMKVNHNGIIYTFFSNGDKLQEFPDGTNSYKYSSNGAIEVLYKNNIRVIFFANGQIQHYTPDGKCHIVVPDTALPIEFS